MAPSDYSSHEHFILTFPHPYIAIVTVSRPEKLNAWYEPMWHSLGSIFRQLSHDPSIRAIILTAAGDRAFTAGLDVQKASTSGALSNKASDPARTGFALRRHILEFQDQLTAVEKCEKPVIAVLFGIAYGLAIDLTTCCDIRLCAKGTRFCVKEVDIGLAADVGTLTRLPKAQVPMSWVKDVCLTAREFGAEEALRVGFVSGVCEDKGKTMERAVELARLIAEKSPVAVASTKEVINFSRDHSVADGLNYVAVWNSAALQTKDVEDAMMAGLTKKKPTFSKL